MRKRTMYVAREGRLVQEGDGAPIAAAVEVHLPAEQAAILAKLMAELQDCIVAFRKNEQLIWQFWAEWNTLKDRLPAMPDARMPEKRGRHQISTSEGVGIFSAFRR